MNRFKRFLPSPIELLVVAMVWTGLALLVYPAVQVSRNPKGPHGAMIPQEPPDERNRVFHPTGLSIVAPLNWDEIQRDYPLLGVVSRGSPVARGKSSIFVQKTDVPSKETLGKCQALTFQGWPAYEKMQIDREDTFDDPAYSSYELYVNQNDEWWLVQFTIADEMTELPPQIRRFIDTIRFP